MPDLVERIEDERLAVDDSFKITREGLLAINADPDEGAHAAMEAPDPKGGATTAPEAQSADTTPDRATRAQTRTGTKQAMLIDMLRRDEGATIARIAEATGWQRHTVRGAISGALKKKLGLTVTSEKAQDGERVYRIIDNA